VFVFLSPKNAIKHFTASFSLAFLASVCRHFVNSKTSITLRTEREKNSFNQKLYNINGKILYVNWTLRNCYVTGKAPKYYNYNFEIRKKEFRKRKNVSH
jgi:hypothetical protein